MDSFSSFFSLVTQPYISLIIPKSSSSHLQSHISSPTSSKIYALRKFPKTEALEQSPPPSPSIPRTQPKTDTLQPKTVSTRRYRTTTETTPNRSLSTILNTLDDMINKFIDPPTHSAADPRFVLWGNFAPVEELPPTECEVVEGTLPSCLDGAYIRNGPNPQFLPRGPYHLFDGDGMLHSISISSGKAILCSRYVKTNKYMIEREAGTNILPNFFSGYNGLPGSMARWTLAAARFIAGEYDVSNGIGLANTSLVFFGNQLYALGESDLPYKVRLNPNGDIETLGRSDFDGKLYTNMTAHPKIDLDTGEVFAFRYSPVPPFLTFFRFDSKGNKHVDVPIFSMRQLTFIHDFAITKKYAIIPDIQLEMNPLEIMMRGGSPVGLNAIKISRIGVIPRYARNENDMRWFDVPGFNILHAINAWDEVDEDGNEAIIMVAPNILAAEHTLDRMDLAHALLEKVKIDLKTGLVSRQPLSARNLDFAVINPAYMGKKNKYVYAAVGDPMPKLAGLVKLDISVAQDARECTVASRMYGPECYGGEPFFVASKYLLSYVHDENQGESRFLVMDAKSPSLETVASVKLPQRVPYGFHGFFVREKDLKRTWDTMF